jgi:hypothetical protein
MAATMERAAFLSACRTWRYWLLRRWDAAMNPLVVIGLNPSTADETQDDPTIRRCVRFAELWGCGGLLMLNLFAFRATDPKALAIAADPIGPMNDEALARESDGRVVLCAWGRSGGPATAARAKAVAGRLLALDRKLYCLARNKDGSPKHPLYMRGDALPQPWSPP